MAYLDHYKINFPSLSNIKESNELFFKFLDREFSIPPKTLVETFSLLVLKYTERDFYQIIKIVLKSQDLFIIVSVFYKSCKKALKIRTLDVY